MTHKKKTPKHIKVICKARARHSFCGRHIANSYDKIRTKRKHGYRIVNPSLPRLALSTADRTVPQVASVVGGQGLTDTNYSEMKPSIDTTGTP